MYPEYSKDSLCSPEIIVLDYITFCHYFLSRIESRLPVNHCVLDHLDLKNRKNSGSCVFSPHYYTQNTGFIFVHFICFFYLVL